MRWMFALIPFVVFAAAPLASASFARADETLILANDRDGKIHATPAAIEDKNANERAAEGRVAEGRAEEDRAGKKDGAKAADIPVDPQGVWMANHSVRMRRDGNVPGQLRSIGANNELVPVHARISFLQDNELIGKSVTEQNGFFQAVGLQEGVYDVVAVGRDGFGAFALKVSAMGDPVAAPNTKTIAFRDGRDRGMSEEERWEHLVLSTTLIPPVDLYKTGQVVAYRIASFRQPGGAQVQGTRVVPSPGKSPAPKGAETLPAPTQPSQLPGKPTGFPTLGSLLRGDRIPVAAIPTALPGSSRSRAIAELPASMLPDDGPWYSGHSIALRPNGNLSGRLRTFDVQGNLIPVVAHVHFIQEGRLVGMTLADGDGRFAVDGLTIGNYSVVVAGENALGAFSIRVLPPDGQEKDNLPPPAEGKAGLGSNIPARTVSLRTIPSGLDMFISTIRFANFPRVLEQMLNNENLAAGMQQPSIESGGGGGAGTAPAAGGGGGGGGGGGAGGGGGGIGGIAAGLGGIGALAALGQQTATNSSAATTNTTNP